MNVALLLAKADYSSGRVSNNENGNKWNGD